MCGSCTQIEQMILDTNINKFFHVSKQVKDKFRTLDDLFITLLSNVFHL